jgi:UDP-galactopyranose mutase
VPAIEVVPVLRGKIGIMDDNTTSTDAPDNMAVLLCFSHLRWNFVTQRPQHLMQRFAREMTVLYWEEPEYGADSAYLSISNPTSGVVRIVPQLVSPDDWQDNQRVLNRLLDAYLSGHCVAVRWYYTPMMLPFSRHVPAERTVYDCMDELSNFRFAPARLKDLERELLTTADVVFTGGHSLYEAKRALARNVHAFPSSVDVAHFARARGSRERGDAQVRRIGFAGVIDERMDLGLLAAVADARPDCMFEMIGPVVKIDRATLPKAPNICWAGPVDYADLPTAMARWDVAIMPFAINAATRFISPTKTPEYLAAGLPVVSTPISDVVRSYGGVEGVWIAAGATAFVTALDEALRLDRCGTWLEAADRLLAEGSWDRTAASMRALIALPSATPESYDVLVVGAGFAGSVMAERLASDAGLKVLVIDRRGHIGGNAYDRHDDAGILMHQYGPHIFHTNSTEIVDYLSQFTKWHPYEHRVLAAVEGKLVPIPINRTTLNALYAADLESDEDAAAFLAARAEPVENVRTSEDVVVSAVGRDLYEKFFRGYTRKQWGLDPSELDKSVTARVPTRTNTDDRYFADRFQAMPRDGYTAMFKAMLDHPNITVRVGVDYSDIVDTVAFDHLVFTGPVDEYFGKRYGALPYRSLRFVHETHDVAELQPVATVNYPSEDVPFTRITEYKHLTGQTADRTTITYEYPSAGGDPYYPIPRDENHALFKRYEALATEEAGVTFVGRLATYRYYNMDQVVGQALAAYRRLRTSGKLAVMDAVAA